MLPLAALGGTALSGEATLPLDRYVSELEGLAGTVRDVLKTTDVTQRKQILESLTGRIPSTWSVDMGGERILVTRVAIDDVLVEIRKDPAVDARWWEMMVLLETMAREGRAGTIGQSSDHAVAAQRLEEILSQSDFAGVHRANQFESFMKKIVTWIDDLLSVFRKAGVTRAPLQFLGWVILAISFVFAVVWVLRAARGRDALQALGPVTPSEPLARDWSSWASDAAAAARQGQYREAVRCAYWAGIQKLAIEGMWDLQRDRTHREYLRALPAGHPLGPDLTEMTRSFEWIWYGRRPATAEELSRMLAHLRNTGVTIAWPPPTGAS